MKLRGKNHAVNSALGDIRASAEAAKKITRIGQTVDVWRHDCFERHPIIALPAQNTRTGLWVVRVDGIFEPIECSRLLVPETAEIEWHDARIEKPDDNTTVLVGFHDGDAECGFWDSEFGCWRNINGERYEENAVVAWAELPAVPARLVKTESEAKA